MTGRDLIKKNAYIFIFSILTLLTFVVLFFSRSLDDNRLTNWQWALNTVDASKVFLILLLGITIAWLLSNVKLIDRYPSVFLLVLSYTVTSLFWREPEVIIDVSRYFTQAKHLEVYGIGYFFREWGRAIIAWTDMPLVPFLYGLIFKCFGESRLYIQMFTTFLFSMTVVLTYHLGNTLWDEDTGLFGGMFLLGMPYLFIQVPLMLVDVSTMFFLTLSIVTFVIAMEKGGKFIALSASAMFLAFFSKYSAWLMMSVMPVILLAYMISRAGKRYDYFYRGLITFSVGAVLIGIVLWYKFDVFSEQMRLLINFQKPGLGKWTESFSSTFFFQIHPFITALALYSIYAAARQRDPKYLIIVWMLILVVVLQIRRIRYIVMVFPMFALMASYGLVRIRDRAVSKFIALCAVFSAIVIALFIYLPFIQRISMVNLMEAGHYLDSLSEPDIRVFTITIEKPVANIAVSVPVLDLFTKKKIHYEYKADSSADSDEIKVSPLRFTWAYKNPEYYVGAKEKTDSTAIAVISDKADDELPDHVRQATVGYRLSRVFSVSEGVFLYRTSVRIYRAGPSGKGGAL